MHLIIFFFCLDIVKEVIETRAELYRAMGEDGIAEISSSNNTSTNLSDDSQKNEVEGQGLKIHFKTFKNKNNGI